VAIVDTRRPRANSLQQSRTDGGQRSPKWPADPVPSVRPPTTG
jgi:hypothetical protein